MKSAANSLGLLLISFQSIGQVIVSGEVVNAPIHAQAEITYYNNTIEWTEISASTVPVDSSGHFKMTFTLKEATSAKLIIAKQYTNIFLVPGDSIHLTVDYNKFDETIYYSGKGAAANNYLAADLLADFKTKANRYSAFNDADKFKRYIDSLESVNIEFLKAYDASGFSEEFRNYITATTRYRFINPRWMYKVGYDNETKKFFDKPVPENYFDFLRSVDLDDEQAYDNSTYNTALMRYLFEFHDSKIEIPDSLSELQKIQMYIRENYNYRKLIFKNNVLEYQLTSFLKQHIGLIARDVQFADELIDDYKSICKNPVYISIVDSIYLQANKLAPGNPAPDFSLTNIDDKSISLSSLKGKVVFIDFWATWCVPCISAMSQTHRLIQYFSENNAVVFLNVNVNDDMRMWKNFVLKEKMPGEHLFATKEQSDNLYKSYNFSGIPHYVLIDKHGKIIDANANNSEKTKLKIQSAVSDMH